MTAQHTNDSSFEADVLKSSKPVLVDFWAEWCGPCRQLSPILDQLATEMGDTISVVKVNIEESPDVPTKFGIRGVPTMILFKDGEAVATKVGALPKAKLQEWVEAQIA